MEGARKARGDDEAREIWKFMNPTRQVGETALGRDGTYGGDCGKLWGRKEPLGPWIG